MRDPGLTTAELDQLLELLAQLAVYRTVTYSDHDRRWACQVMVESAEEAAFARLWNQVIKEDEKMGSRERTESRGKLTIGAVSFVPVDAQMDQWWARAKHGEVMGDARVRALALFYCGLGSAHRAVAFNPAREVSRDEVDWYPEDHWDRDLTRVLRAERWTLTLTPSSAVPPPVVSTPEDWSIEKGVVFNAREISFARATETSEPITGCEVRDVDDGLVATIPLDQARVLMEGDQVFFEPGSMRIELLNR